MLGRVQPRVFERVLDERFVGQRFQRGAGFAHQHEQGPAHVDALEHGGGVVGVHVADEAGFQLEAAVLFGPALQGQVHGAGAQIAAADADLHGGGEFFALFVGDLAAVHLLGKFSGLFLLGHIEIAFVDAVGHHVATQLAAA